MPRGTEVSLLVVLDDAPHGRLRSATVSQRAALAAPHGSLWSATVSQRAALTEADACGETDACAEPKDCDELKFCAELKDCDNKIPVVGICAEMSSVSITPPSRLILGSSTDSDSSGPSGKSRFAKRAAFRLEKTAGVPSLSCG